MNGKGYMQQYYFEVKGHLLHLQVSFFHVYEYKLKLNWKKTYKRSVHYFRSPYIFREV